MKNFRNAFNLDGKNAQKPFNVHWTGPIGKCGFDGKFGELVFEV